MTDTTLDLTGRWTGVYFYPHDHAENANDNLPATPFTAELSDIDGHVTGSTVEPDMMGPKGAPPIPATLKGNHHGGQLVFTKFPRGGRTHTIDYEGAISEDGNTIEGRWVIPGDWSGTFRMSRRDVAATQQTDQAATA